MLAAGLVVLATLVSPGSCQYIPSFQPDSLNSMLGTFVVFCIFCIFAFLFFLLIGWCFVALVLARGHRLPYGFLFSATILLFFYNADGIVRNTLDSFRLSIALNGISYLFYNWATLFLFLALVAVLWNRESAIHAATGEKTGRHNSAVTTVHATLAGFVFVLGTVAPAICVVADMKSRTADYSEGWDDYYKQVRMYENLSYAYSAFVILTAVDVNVSTTLLWSASRAMRVTDMITNTMFYVVAPLYLLLNLSTMIFTIVFSDKLRHNIAIPEAVIASHILLLLIPLGIIAVLLVISAKRTNWVVRGVIAQPVDEKPEQQQHWLQACNGHGLNQSQLIGQPTVHGSNGHQTHVLSAPFQQTSYLQNKYAVPHLPEPQS